CVTAQGHFDFRREPAQVEMIWLRDKKRSLGEVHLPGNGLEPVSRLPGGKKADRRRVAGKRAVGEGVNVKEWKHHFRPRQKAAGTEVVHGESKSGRGVGSILATENV